MPDAESMTGLMKDGPTIVFLQPAVFKKIVLESLPVSTHPSSWEFGERWADQLPWFANPD